MHVTKRDIAILSGFTFLVVAFAGATIYLRSRPPNADSSGDDVGAVGSAEAISREELVALEQFVAIAERDIFRPLTFELASLTSLGDESVEGPTRLTASRSPARRPTPRSGSRPTYIGPRGPTPASSDSEDEEEEDAEPCSLAVTGVVRDSYGLRALIEDDEGNSQFVRIGAAAFGYTVRYLTARGAVLERAGRFYVLTLGQNKLRGGKSGSHGSSYHVDIRERTPPRRSSSSRSQSIRGGFHMDDPTVIVHLKVLNDALQMARNDTGDASASYTVEELASATPPPGASSSTWNGPYMTSPPRHPHGGRYVYDSSANRYVSSSS